MFSLIGFTESYRGAEFEVRLLKKVRFEIAVNDEFLERTKEAIIKRRTHGQLRRRSDLRG